MIGLFERKFTENPPSSSHEPRGMSMRNLRLPTSIRVLGAVATLAVLIIVLGYGLLRVLGPSERFSTFELPYTEDFQTTDIKRWFTVSGVWSIRNETLAQITDLDERAHVFVPKTVAEDQFYHLSTYITLSSKTRSTGINFNAQYPKLTQHMHQLYLNRVPSDNLPEAETSDEAKDALELVAGYTDDEGTFIPQVTVSIAEEAVDYRVDLFVTDNTYAVQLNGQTLIEKRPLFYPNGVIGFHSVGPVKFDSLKISVAEDASPDELVYTSDFDQENGGAGWVPFAGDRELGGSELVQSQSNQREAGIGYEGSAFENFALQSTFRHIEGTGGGLLFNLPSPYQVKRGHMVRFSDQTSSIFWGYYDEAGQFERQGFANINEIGAADQTLRVYSDNASGSYDIYHGEDLMARAVPLQRNTGHIGLITAFSSVAYAEVEVFPLFTGKTTGLPTLSLDEQSQDSEPTASSVTASEPSPNEIDQRLAVVPGSTNLSVPSVPTTVTPAPVILAGNTASIAGSFSGDILASGWSPISQSWQFEDGALVQKDAIKADQAIVYTTNAFRNYSYEARLTHLEGSARACSSTCRSRIA